MSANNGAVAVKYGLSAPTTRSDMVQAARQAAETAPTDHWLSLPSPKTRPVHSEKLVRCLTAHRVAAVQAELLDRPRRGRWPRSPHIWRKVPGAAMPGAPVLRHRRDSQSTLAPHLGTRGGCTFGCSRFHSLECLAIPFGSHVSRRLPVVTGPGTNATANVRSKGCRGDRGRNRR